MSHKYYCPDCKVTLSTAVKPTTEPVHPCPRHANKVRPLTAVETKEKTPAE